MFFVSRETHVIPLSCLSLESLRKLIGIFDEHFYVHKIFTNFTRSGSYKLGAQTKSINIFFHKLIQSFLCSREVGTPYNVK